MLINYVAVEGFGENMTAEVLRLDHDDPDSAVKLWGKNVVFSEFFCTNPECPLCPQVAKRIRSRVGLAAKIAGKHEKEEE